MSKFSILENQLLANKVILTQSDTVPAIMTRISNLNGIERLYNIKQRSKESKFAIFVSDLEMAMKFCQIDDRQKRVFKEYLPGYYTLIFQLAKDIDISENLFSIDNNGNKRIAIRMPKNPSLLSMIQRLGEPIVATSANISKAETPKKLSEVSDIIRDAVDITIDLEIIERGRSSTILDATDERRHVIRK